MIGEMNKLEHTHPDVYEAFSAGNFSVQLSSENTFGRIGPDKCIEMTINKDTKTPGGTTGFSINPNAIVRWNVNASYRAELRKKLHEFVTYSQQKHCHKDLKQSRMKKDEKDVSALLDVLKNTFIEPFSESPLLCISSGVLATEDVSRDLRDALSKGNLFIFTFHFFFLNQQPLTVD